MHIVKEHECTALNETNRFAVQEYSDEKWYWVDLDCNGNVILNQILFCPYCGEKLD